MALAAARMGPLCGLLAIRAARGEEYSWIVQQDVASPDGYPRSIIAVMDSRFLSVTQLGTDPNNDKLSYSKPQQLPGPEIRARRGERVVVRVENRLPDTTVSIHWHGLHMRDQAWMDGTAGVTGCPIEPNGGVGTYNFTVDQGPGTHWWHSHVGTQYADGIFGAFVIEPAEGETDPVQATTPYTGDEVLTLQDWLHETYHDISTRYMTRIGAFSATYRDSENGKDYKLPFLPDYPWPSTHVLLNGRGQTDCKWVYWEDCDEVRLRGWAYYFNHSEAPPGNVTWGSNDLPEGTYGQCIPEREPLMGKCKPDADPAELRCQAGGATRLRLINTGYSMPLRFWVTHHEFMVVARDGVPIVPTGPHFAVVVPVGGRLDVVVYCSASPSYRYQVFAMVALREFYPGAQHLNREAHSYAVLTYGSPIRPGAREAGAQPLPLREPDVSPRMFLQAGDSMTRCCCDCNYRQYIYQSWDLTWGDYVPVALDRRMRPLPAAGYLPVSAPPAQERIVVSVGGKGNWWNNMSNSESLFGRKFEWWNMNGGASWTDSTMPLYTPREPIMLSRLNGKNITETYGESDPKRLPFVQVLAFNRSSPITYELVVVNHEGQQHPFHLHGHTLQKVADGWLDPDRKWRSSNRTGSLDWLNLLKSHDQPTPAMVHLDTFTLAPSSYTVFRLTADNPGAWMMHCHMDYHLGAGQGMVWSTELDGRYPLPPPPANFGVCGRGTMYGARAEALRGASAQALPQPPPPPAAPVAAAAASAFALGLCGGLAAVSVLSARGGRGPPPGGVPRVLGSPTGSYHGVSD